VGEGDREEPCHYTQTAAACLEGMGRESERERERERERRCCSSSSSNR